MKPTIQRMSPQIAQVSTLSATMLDVIVALVPALLMGVYLFGLQWPSGMGVHGLQS